MPISSTKGLQQLWRILESRPWLAFGAFLFINAGLLWPRLLNPPIWDEAFSVFPAADFLAHHQFDYGAMLKLPGFVEGGPTTHGLTLPTLYTAVVLKCFGGGKTAWCILHSWQWLLGAGIGTLLVLILRPTHGMVTAFLIAGLTLYCPLMLTQMGNMYLEVPLLFFWLLAFYLFLRNNIPGASLAALFACATKDTGFVAVIALALTAGFMTKPFRNSLRTILTLVLPSLAWLSFLHYCRLGTAGALGLADEPLPTRWWLFLVQAVQKYLLPMPDMLILFVAATVIAAYYTCKIARAEAAPQPESKLRFFCSLLVLGFIGFHFVVWASFANLSNFACRYLVFILPAIWVLIETALRGLFAGERVKQCLLTAALALLLVNRYGLFYPPLVTSDIGVGERSGENQDGFLVQQAYMRYLESELPTDVPIFHGLPEAYLGQFPVLGYVSKPLNNGILITRYTHNQPAKLDRFPDRFYLLYFFPIVGADQLLGVYHEALGRSDWKTQDVASFIRGNFKAFLVLIERNSQRPGPSGSVPNGTRSSSSLALASARTPGDREQTLAERGVSHAGFQLVDQREDHAIK